MIQNWRSFVEDTGWWTHARGVTLPVVPPGLSQSARSDGNPVDTGAAWRWVSDVFNRVYRQRGFSLRSKGAHEIMWRWHVKIQNMAKFSRKIAFPIGTRGQKRSNFPKMPYISRSSPVVQKLEQLEQNNKKHLKAHSAGYRRLHIGFELKSFFKVIKGQNSVLCENSFSWIIFQVLKLEPLF